MSETNLPATSQNPFKNPTYPQRTHVKERAHWQGVLAACEAKVAEAGRVLVASPNHPRRADLERLYAQMLGARDQVADKAKRLPLEAGGLYHEDKEKLEEGVAAMARVEARWNEIKG